MGSSEALSKKGILYAIAAYSTWGFVPLFWIQLKMIPPIQILAHRIIWSLLFFVIIFVIKNELFRWLKMVKDPVVLKKSLPSGLAIGVNWGLYIYAVNSGHALESSLGYFINPIFNVLIGAVAFQEKLNKLQWTAFSFASAGVILLTALNGRLPWIALALASTFSLYGVLRKKSRLDGTKGTAVESLLLLPVAAFIFSKNNLAPVDLLTLENPVMPALLLSLGGALTALPLVWFSKAAQHLPLSSLGFFQYISPTFQFLIAVFVFREPFDSGKLISFVLIWLGLAIFVFGSARSRIQERNAPSRAST